MPRHSHSHHKTSKKRLRSANEAELKGDRLVKHDTQPKKWGERIIEPENYDWKKEEEIDLEEENENKD